MKDYKKLFLVIMMVIGLYGVFGDNLECISTEPNNAFPNQVCSQYSGSSCCSLNQDAYIGRILSLNLRNIVNASDDCIEEINRLSCGLFCEPISGRFRSGSNISLCDSKCLDIYTKCYNTSIEGIKTSTYTPEQFCTNIFDWFQPFLDSFEMEDIGINQLSIINSNENATSDACFNGGVFANSNQNIYNTNAHSSHISGNGIYESIENQESKIFITAIDDNGNQRQVGGDDIILLIENIQFTYQVLDTSDGKYIITYIPHLNGLGDTTTNLTISINGIQLPHHSLLIKESTYCVLSAPVGIPFKATKNAMCSEFYSASSCCNANELNVRMTSIRSVANMFGITGNNSTQTCSNIWYELQCGMFCDPRQSLLWYDGGFSISPSYCSKFFSACQNNLLEPTTGDTYTDADSFCEDLNLAILKILVPTFFSPHPSPEQSFSGVDSYAIAFSQLTSIESEMSSPPYLVTSQLQNDLNFTLYITVSDIFGNPIVRNFGNNIKRSNLVLFEIDSDIIPTSTSFHNSKLAVSVGSLHYNASLYQASLILDGSLNIVQSSNFVQGFPKLLFIIPGPLCPNVIILDSHSIHSSICGYPETIHVFGTDSYGNKLYYPLSNTNITLQASNSSHFEYSFDFDVAQNMWTLHYTNYDSSIQNFTLTMSTNGVPITTPPFQISSIAYFISHFYTRGIVGSFNNFTINARNGSVIIPNLISPEFFAKIRGPNDSLVYQPTELDGDITLVVPTGEYIVRFYPTMSGTYNVSAFMKVPENNTELNLNKQGITHIPIHGSPFAEYLSPQAAQCAYTTASGPGLSVGINSFPLSFTISSKDQFGNLVPSSNLTYSIMLSQGGRAFPSNKYFFNVANQSNGLFSVNYTTIASYNVLLSILCLDPLTSNTSVQIEDGPFNVRFPINQICIDLAQCSNNGACIESQCYCSSGYSGSYCQIPPPPMLISASFSAKLITFELLFDKNTNKAGSNGQATSCSSYFDNDTKSKFTSNSFCYWRNERILVVFPGTNSTVTVNDTITFLPYLIKDETNFSGYSVTNLSLPLSIPAVINPFMLSIIAPSLVNYRSNFSFDISGSIGTGGRPLKNIVWSAAVLSAGPTTDIDSLNDFLETQTSSVIIFNSEQLEVGIYNFTVSAQNFLGFNDSISFNLSVLNITKTQVNSGIGDFLIVSTSSYLSFVGQVSTPCFTQDQLNFEKIDFAWVRTSGNFFQVDSVLSVDKNFLITPGTIPPQSVFNLDYGATIDESEKLSSYDRIKVIVQPSLFANIKFGNQRISRIQNITLDATSSLDPGTNYTLFDWEWSCTTSTFGPLVNCLQGSLSDSVFINSPIITIPPGTLWIGNHTVYLTIRQKTSVNNLPLLEKSHSINLNLELYDAPVVQISGVEHNRISSNQRLSLNVTITSLLGNGILGVNVSFNPPIDNSRVVITRFYGIEVQPNTFQPGLIYNVTVVAQDRNGYGSASLPIAINEAPLGGNVKVEMNSFDNIESNLTVSFSLWEDDYLDYPLSYNVGYFKYDGQSKQLVPLLLQPSLSRSYEITLPLYATSLQVEVCDTYGACNIQEVSIPVSASFNLTNSTINTVSSLISSLPNLARYGNYERILHIVQFSIQLLNNESPISNISVRFPLRSNLTSYVLYLPITRLTIHTYAKLINHLSRYPQEILDEDKLSIVLKIKELINFQINDLEWDDSKLETYTLFLDSLSRLRNVTNVKSYSALVSRESILVENMIAQAMLTPKLFGASPLSITTNYTYLYTIKDDANNLPIFYFSRNTSTLVPRRLLTNAGETNDYLDAVFIVYLSPYVRSYANNSKEQTSNIASLSVRNSESRQQIQPNFNTDVNLYNFTETFVPLSEVRIESSFDNLLDPNTLPNNVTLNKLRCAVWDESSQSWSEEGCFVVTSKTTPTHTFCQCASFGGFATLQSVSNITVAQPPTTVVSQFDLESKDAMLIAILGGLALLILVLLFALRSYFGGGGGGKSRSKQYVPIVAYSSKNRDELVDIPKQSPLKRNVQIFVNSDLPVISEEFTDYEASDY